MAELTEEYSFANLVSPQNTTSGISQFILLAPVSTFAAGGIKCPKAPFVNRGDKARILVPHVFKDGKAFNKLICAPRKNKLDAKSIGEVGFSKADITVEFFVAGSYAEVHEAMSEYMNIPLIGMVKDSECDAEIWYQIGCDCIFGYITWDFSTGTEVDGVKGYMAKLNCSGKGIRLYAAAGGPEIADDEVVVVGP